MEIKKLRKSKLFGRFRSTNRIFTHSEHRRYVFLLYFFDEIGVFEKFFLAVFDGLVLEQFYHFRQIKNRFLLIIEQKFRKPIVPFNQ